MEFDRISREEIKIWPTILVFGQNGLKVRWEKFSRRYKVEIFWAATPEEVELWLLTAPTFIKGIVLELPTVRPRELKARNYRLSCLSGRFGVPLVNAYNKKPTKVMKKLGLKSELQT